MIKLDYGEALACICGSNSLRAMHSHGARVICNTCGILGSFAVGCNYQLEEYVAIQVWNKQIETYNNNPYELKPEKDK